MVPIPEAMVVVLPISIHAPTRGATYNGAKYFIHCAGRAYGTEDLPNGRVGISRLRGSNDYNPVTGGHFSPAMKGCNFRYFRRPNFAFRED